MKNYNAGLKNLSNRLGFYSSLLSILMFLVYTVCFTLILVVNPLFEWKGVADFVSYQIKYNQMYKYIGMVSMLLFGICYIIMLNAIQECADDDKKIMARIGVNFGVAFEVLLSINYFIQISAVRFNVEHGRTEGLEQFVQSNPISMMTSVNILAWTLFLGLSSLFISQVFSGGRLEKVIKYAFISNGVILLLGGAGYVLNIYVLVFLCVNFGMAAPLLTAATALCILFRRNLNNVGNVIRT